MKKQTFGGPVISLVLANFHSKFPLAHSRTPFMDWVTSDQLVVTLFDPLGTIDLGNGISEWIWKVTKDLQIGNLVSTTERKWEWLVVNFTTANLLSHMHIRQSSKSRYAVQICFQLMPLHLATLMNWKGSNKIQSLFLFPPLTLLPLKKERISWHDPLQCFSSSSILDCSDDVRPAI